VMGRMLAYEWERVNRELELRRLKEQLRDAEKTDPATGVENRQSFLATVERDWLLTQRGTLSSYLVVVELSGLDAAKGQFGDAMGDLFLRDVARALQAVSRKTDAVGRVGDNRFAVLLVGCNGDAGAVAFINRMRIALARTMSERPATVDTAIGFHALADSTSASDALESAERIVHEAPSGPLEGALGPS
jgi:diguanylate cyclase (GGDEF)-like protein